MSFATSQLRKAHWFEARFGERRAPLSSSSFGNRVVTRALRRETEKSERHGVIEGNPGLLARDHSDSLTFGLRAGLGTFPY